MEKFNRTRKTLKTNMSLEMPLDAHICKRSSIGNSTPLAVGARVINFKYFPC